MLLDCIGLLASQFAAPDSDVTVLTSAITGPSYVDVIRHLIFKVHLAFLWATDVSGPVLAVACLVAVQCRKADLLANLGVVRLSSVQVGGASLRF